MYHLGGRNTSGTYVPVSLNENNPAGQQLSGEDPEHAAAMQERLVGIAAGGAGGSGGAPMVATSKPVMEVVAPADLPEGYEFDVSLGPNGGLYKVQVPPGGVEKGQTFSVPMPEQFTSHVTGVHIPVGHWRDELFDCFKYGVCHPHCWTSWMCTFLATGQVIRRMQFKWSGSPTEKATLKASAFPLIFGIVVVYFVLHFIMLSVLLTLDPNHGKDSSDPTYQDIPPPPAFYAWAFLYRIWSLVYWVLSTVVLIRTRRNVRQRYGIPAVHDLEDCCCSVWCHCCVAAQMLRHTTDYDIYPSYLCTDTGLPAHVPAIV